jgi:hypothetical protein
MLAVSALEDVAVELVVVPAIAAHPVFGLLIPRAEAFLALPAAMMDVAIGRGAREVLSLAVGRARGRIRDIHGFGPAGTAAPMAAALGPSFVAGPRGAGAHGMRTLATIPKLVLPSLLSKGPNLMAAWGGVFRVRNVVLGVRRHLGRLVLNGK